MPIFKKPPFRGNADKKRDMPEGLWHKCPGCGEVIHELELKKSLRVCPHCNYHFTLSAPERIESLSDPGTFKETDKGMASVDALNFKGYKDKLTKYQKITGLSEAIITGKGKVIGHSVVLAVMDFRFLGASMGSVVGEKITRAIELATKEKTAVIIISASGGARMHEGILSLMQMAKTSGALAVHDRAGLPFISVLTHPTTGGVTASFATLGDIILAEPGCMIGFAGPRVIKETTHQELPEGFQTAEFMHQHGLVDMIVERREMREKLASILGYLLP
ncbi:MAG: acetyl-CoA carboxylase, carboxyltransferase subunit beta [Verrucomicrobiota bacterium]|nr:acetyl-CoA carboxylase, carboxyltransferase subunit beta [Verrucomicrobiota bacterium]MEC8690888.1 acetyl-CoA carboxylase, carboxyltransferase subunit beta [Verrucomicrobiota bacterium]